MLDVLVKISDVLQKVAIFNALQHRVYGILMIKHGNFGMF
jgi:hypothetical protein